MGVVFFSRFGLFFLEGELMFFGMIIKVDEYLG